MNRDFRKFKSFLSNFPFLHSMYQKNKNTENTEKWRRSRTQYFFFFLLIYFRAGTPTITVEGSGLDMDSISVVSSIAPSHIYQCKCPKHKSLIVVSYPYLHRRPPFISLSLSLSLFVFFLSFFFSFPFEPFEEFLCFSFLSFSLLLSVFLFLSINTKYLVSCKLCFFLLLLLLLLFLDYLFFYNLNVRFFLETILKFVLGSRIEYWGKLDLISFN